MYNGVVSVDRRNMCASALTHTYKLTLYFFISRLNWWKELLKFIQKA